MKKLLALLLSAGMITALTACTPPAESPDTAESTASSPASESAGSTQAEEPAPSETAGDGEKVTIIWAHGADSTGADKAVADAFMAANPQIEIQQVELPSDQGAQHDAYVTSFAAGGKDYDVIASNVIWPAEFSEAGYVLPVDTFIERDSFPIDDFMPGYVDAYTFKGRMWGIPNHSNSGLLYYRTDIVDAPPKTWDELYTMAGESVGKEGTKFGYVYQAAQYEGLVCNAMEFIGAYGGSVVDGDGNIIVDNQGVRDGLDMMRKFTQSAFVPSNITTFKENECNDAFAAGDAVFMRNWPGSYSNLQDEEKSNVVGKVGVAALPAGSAGSFGALGGWGCMINKNTDHPDEAWEFVKFKCGPEGQKINATVGSQPPLYMPLYEDQEVLDSNPFFGILSEAVESAIPRPVSPVYTELSNIMQIEISKAISAVSEVDAAVAAMDTEMKAIVEK